MVIYHHSMVIPSFCVIKLYYLRNYCGMAVNYCGILTLERVGLNYRGNLLWYSFITLGPGNPLWSLLRASPSQVCCVKLTLRLIYLPNFKVQFRIKLASL